MLLVAKLPGEKIYRKWSSFGIFFCPYCRSYVKKMRSGGKRDKSCGCYGHQLTGKAHITHGDCRNNNKNNKSRIYNILDSMKQRCYNENHKNYKNYGGRGIKICKEWDNYIIFKIWALNHGYKDNLEIDRRNNDGNYEPSNCRWITRKKNLRNTRRTKLNEDKVRKIRSLYKNVKISQTLLAKIFGISRGYVCLIIQRKYWGDII